MNGMSGLIWLIVWAAGIVIAHGFWSTAAAVCTGGLWSMYLVVELALTRFGVLL